MSGVITKFAVTSMVMWMAPVAIMYGFYYQIFPGVSQLSSSTQTLASGFLAVISVNLVIGFYICMAMKETPTKSHNLILPSWQTLKQVLASQHLPK